MTDLVRLARVDSSSVPVPTPPLRWYSVADGPMISDIYGRLGNLARHGVHANGEVYPSVLMQGGTELDAEGKPTGRTHPDWHVYVVLSGWDRGERPEK